MIVKYIKASLRFAVPSLIFFRDLYVYGHKVLKPPTSIVSTSTKKK